MKHFKLGPVSENNPETIDSVRNIDHFQEFPKLSEKKTKKASKQKKTTKTTKTNKETNTHQTNKTPKNKALATSLPTTIFGQIFFFWLLGPQSFVLCRNPVLNH